MALIYCYGGETGAIVAGAGPDAVGGAPTAVTRPAGFGHGSYCLRVAPPATTGEYAQWTRFTPATFYLGFALNLSAFGSSTGMSIVQAKAFGTAGASKFPTFGVDGGTKKLFFQNAAGTKLVDTTVRATTDNLFVELLFDFSGATWTYRWMVNGAELAAITGDAQVASTLNYVAIGNVGGNSGPYAAYIDDIFFGNASADFGSLHDQDARVLAVGVRGGAGGIDLANSVGATRFHDETGAAVTDASGNSIAQSAGVFGSTTRYLVWDGASPGATDRLAINLYDTGETISARLVCAYAQLANTVDASANAVKAAVVAGGLAGTETALLNGSVGQTTPKYRQAVLTAPAGGWTPANVNATVATFGAGAAANNAGGPALDALVLEAGYVGTTASVALANRTAVVTKVTDGTATSIAAGLPAGVGDGELLSLVVACADQTITDMPAPSGWTRRAFSVSTTGGGQVLGWFVKAAVAADAGATVTVTVTGGTSGQRELVAVATSIYDSGTGSAIQFDAAATPAEDATGPALTAPQAPAASSAPCAILSAVTQDQSAGAEPAFGSVTTDSGGTVTKIADAVESTTALGLAVAVEFQTTPVAATHTFNYTGGGTAARGGVLGSVVAVVASATTNPPATPVGLAAASVTDVQVTLSWTANSDGRAAAYNVYRDGVLTGTTSTTSFQDTTVAAATSYGYSISAVDSNGNESAQSATVNVTTAASAAAVQVGGLLSRVLRTTAAADAIPPSVPPGVTAAAQSSSSIKVSWNASSDNVAVANYRVRRGGTLIATVPAGTLTFTDTGLAASTTYSYTVEAVDGAGNTSGQSVAATAQTLAASGSTSWASATAYAQTPPSFSPLRTIVCSTFSDFQSAWNNAQPGDLIDCSGATFTYTGEFIAQSKIGTAANPIRVVFGAGCLFNYTGGQALPAVWFKNNAYVQWFDGRYSTNKTGAQGLRIEQNHDCYVWLREWNGSKVYDCGHDGLFITATTSLPYTYRGASVQAGNYRCDFYIGEITNCGLMWATRDPHGDGSGFHGIQFADGNYGNYDCRVAAYVHDHGYGAGIQAGGSAATDAVKGCTFLVKALNLTNNTNVAYGNGSVLQWWGTGVRDNTVAYIEGTNVAGRIENNENSISLTSCVTQYGRAFNACYKMPAGTNPFDTRGGMQYVDIASS